MIKTDGTWNPNDKGIIWLAMQPHFLEIANIPNIHPYVLIAANEISDTDIPILQDYIDRGTKILLDSGIFWLTNQHKSKFNVTMDEALSLAPHEIDGFDQLWQRYLKLINVLGDSAWGYIELDQGGSVNKRITREKLHQLGINPIPVWHPLNDEDGYFEELASQYDRICMGNIVQADKNTRARLLFQLHQKKKDYPDLFVHILGSSISTQLVTLGFDSCDSSQWLSGVRWGQFDVISLGSHNTANDKEVLYTRGSSDSHNRATTIAGIEVSTAAAMVKHYTDRKKDV